LCSVSGERVPSPQGRDIDDKYLDANEVELKTMFQKWRNEWHEHDVTIMCYLWTGPTHMSVINFLLYSNDRMWFHSSIDASEKTKMLSSY
jgi:hypothetical protein